MSFSRLVLTIDTKLPIGTLQNILNDSSTRTAPFAQKMINYFHALNAGARTATVNSGVVDSGSGAAVAASQTASFGGAATPTDTVTINGVVLTSVASSPTNNQWIAGVSATADAAALAAAINSSTSDALAGVVKAAAVSGVVTVTCLIPGVIGNAIAISKSSSAITLGGSTLASGAGRLPVLSSFSY